MKNILLQLDTDARPSIFDRIVALDAGADDVLAYGGVRPDDIEPLVHGGMFTRGPKSLHQTAVFVGGSDIEQGQRVFDRVLKTYFGPLRLSTMIDSNGANTTAAAAVLSAGRHVSWADCTTLVLGGTGPVGRRVGELVAIESGSVRIASRDSQRARTAAETIAGLTDSSRIEGHEIATGEGRAAALAGVDVIIAAGRAGVQFLSRQEWASLDRLRVAVDVNAVPPVGLEGIEATDNGIERDDVLCYGALGVGGLKMKIHTAAIARLFVTNDQILDRHAIYRLGEELASESSA